MDTDICCCIVTDSEMVLRDSMGWDLTIAAGYAIHSRLFLYTLMSLALSFFIMFTS